MKLCVIPARAGSKRIKNKNTRIFQGEPLVARAIRVAIDAGIFDRVIVSTDSKEITEISLRQGAEVPFIRPANLADDFATSVEVVRHATEMVSQDGHIPEIVGCVYPTSVFLTSDHLRESIEIMSSLKMDCVFSAAKFSSPIERAFRPLEHGGVVMGNIDAFTLRSQDLPIWYHDVGQFYVAHRDHWYGSSLFNERAMFIEFPQWAVQDIDTEDDWALMELKMRMLAEAKLEK
jgi:pseudaminic acid cytidylyltransferase